MSTEAMDAARLAEIRERAMVDGHVTLGLVEVAQILNALAAREAENQRLRATLQDVRRRICQMSGQASSTAIHNAALAVIDAALAGTPHEEGEG